MKFSLELAGSDKYEIYYGYGEEDRLFLKTVLDNPDKSDSGRLAEDYASMFNGTGGTASGGREETAKLLFYSSLKG
jgi:hypothetical protein